MESVNSEPQTKETRLRLELEKTLPRVDFDPLLRSRYRDSMSAEHRLMRTLYYLIPAVLFGAMSLYVGGRFSTHLDLSSLLGRVAFFLFVPVLLLAAVANAGRVRDALSSWINVAACLALWSGILLLRYAAPHGPFGLPREVLGLTLLGGALLCGFRLFPMLCGIGAFTALNLLLELWGGTHIGRFSVDAGLIAVLGACAAAAACSAEASRRRLWIAGQIADFAARNDPLTGLMTRAEFNLRFPLVVAQGRREHQPVSLMLIAIDDLRVINETINHLYGDKVLRGVADQTLTFGNRPLDLKARFAGGKIAIVLYNAEPQAASRLATQLLQAVRSMELEHPTGGAAPRVTLSAGMITLIPVERTTHSELLKIAEALMYQARSNGCDQVVIRSLVEEAEKPRSLGAVGVPQ